VPFFLFTRPSRATKYRVAAERRPTPLPAEGPSTLFQLRPVPIRVVHHSRPVPTLFRASRAPPSAVNNVTRLFPGEHADRAQRLFFLLSFSFPPPGVEPPVAVDEQVGLGRPPGSVRGRMPTPSFLASRWAARSAAVRTRALSSFQPEVRRSFFPLSQATAVQSDPLPVIEKMKDAFPGPGHGRFGVPGFLIGVVFSLFYPGTKSATTSSSPAILIILSCWLFSFSFNTGTKWSQTW